MVSQVIVLMKLLGLFVVGIVALFAVLFMLFSIGVFDDGISGRATGVCPSFSVDSDSGFFVKGSSVVSGCAASNVSDFCVNPCVVGEYVNSALVQINCSFGCVDGACLQEGVNPSLAQYCADRAGDQKLIEDCDNQLDDDTDGDVDCNDTDCNDQVDEGCTSNAKIPIRGLTLGLGKADVTPELLEFILNDLKNEGVNVIQWRADYYHYQFPSHPEVSETSDTRPSLEESDVKQVLAACRDAGIYCFPGVSYFSHQGSGEDAQHRVGLLRAYPQFDITPATATKPARPTINDRSWNPYHPDLHPIIFDLTDDLLDAFEAQDFMVGLDEAYMMPTLETAEYAGTPYYQGQPYAEVYAYEYGLLHDYLQSRGVRMWIWGDELLKYDDWVERDANGNELWPSNEIMYESDTRTGNEATSPAIDIISRDNVIIADWHYIINPATPEYFASKGFDVVSSPWMRSNVALGQLNRHLNANASNAPHMKGMLHTTWVGVGDFMKAYKYGTGLSVPNDASQQVCAQGYCFTGYALGSANTFKDLMAEIRAID